ncbi:ABC transporter ATP-binding protein [Ruminococcus albus]|uniref:ABC-2 type transport system ATP-binding protein n=1 Tax=Ruminococcus albus TaxID=1264 RepID=A0A1H7ID11_RUMAL|nr:ABC transporter ATP-binding protein [Ruminococcus albus]SEK59420.1 ABC-2 type transport system ATP-binding protein [Ruminococcus albus]
MDKKNIALSIKGLSKTIGKKEILHDINMECYAGEVFGFLGPNGAGKTTTIKTVVGLLLLDEGEIQVCGHDIIKEYEDAMSNVGGIVENPEMYKFMSGRDNLKQYARMRGLDFSEIDKAVEMVKLTNRIDDKVSKYSLGMRQRLGVAQALMHKPKLLILDEPTNGLDPQGIKELRDILKDLAHTDGVCVVVSSHLMSEMELMCDRVGIIAKGKMIGTYTMEEIASLSNDKYTEYIIETDDAVKAAEILDGVENISAQEKMLYLKLETENAQNDIAEAIKTLAKNDINIYSVHPKESKKLEEVFIELTGAEGDGQVG